MSLRVEVCQEQAVHQGRLAQAGLSDHHQSELEAFLHRLPVHLVGQVSEAHIAGLLRVHELLREEGERRGKRLLGFAAWVGIYSMVLQSSVLMFTPTPETKVYVILHAYTSASGLS